ncbi:hypothetical protein FPHYL_2979 [Fusarium phyllophilum]|uniref:Uncharacterized protein n=1 Tax=Fusarium phyllophilum TaxID=47803 RepID=A0A8H5NL17_9HYPO|nr:hypothetical protein FPHYL_2979 [Fusarium phyllophilum]
MVVERHRIRFGQHVPNDQGYRSYIKDLVEQFIEDDPHNKGLSHCVACIVQNAGHTSRADQRDHCTVDFFDLAEDGGAAFYTTQHVPAMTFRSFMNRQRRRRRH